MTNRASRLLNIKLSPKCVAGDDGTENRKPYPRLVRPQAVALAVQHCKQADPRQRGQKDPDNYRSLLVRIAGYSAYFCDLSRDLQNDIIDRTEHAQF